MKKVLLGTSAVALAAAYTNQASAAEWDVRIGGYMEQYVAFAASDIDNAVSTDFDGVDSKQDAEIHFKPSITLDNGLRIGVDIQLEGNAGTGGASGPGTPDIIDESFLQIKGSFGEILLGSENSAGYKMSYGAPDVTFVNVNSGSLTAFIPFSGGGGGVATGGDIFRGTLGTTFLENGRNNDANRLTYFTPRFAGFQLGASYARDGLQDTNAQVDLDNNGTGIENIVDIAANYVNSFGGVDVAASIRYGVAFVDAGNNPTIWGAGLNVGFSGVTIGGSFAEQNNSRAGTVDTEDGTSFDVGVSYETGPWGFSFTYMHGENVDEEQALNPLGNDEELDQFLIGASYKLGKGVALNAFGAYVDFTEDTGDAGGAGDDVDGFVIGTGIKVSF